MNYEVLLAKRLTDDAPSVAYLKTLSTEQLSSIVKESMMPPVKKTIIHPPAPKKAQQTFSKMHESIGRMREAMSRMSDTAKKTGFTKVSAVKIATVASWGREMARQDMAKMSAGKKKLKEYEGDETWQYEGSEKKSSVDIFRAVLAKEAAIPALLAGVAGKVLPAAKAAVTKAAPYAQKALQAVGSSPLKQRALVGAGVGAAAGGVRQMTRSPQERQGHSMIGSMVGGAVKGGIVGAAAGPFAQKALQSNILRA
jgi:hypothetical protein